ncbi:MAG: YceH family protein [Acidobacteriota bacterium]|nr:YceH family protein [Acidobacteriota bacterium]MDH3525726.1 YceH family protein [Acidobacteriota bacterium]
MKRLPRTLDAVEIRVLGVLLEKEQATPDYYPMTANAVTQACNQKTNRDPVMALTPAAVRDGLERLFNEDVFAWRSRAARVVKWKQNVDRRWQLTPATKAAITLLLLRGPQTPGEIRARGERLHAFPDLAAAEHALRELAAGDEPLVRELARRPGQKESRWAHLVGGPVAAPAAGPEPATESRAQSPDAGRVARLEERVAELEDAVAALDRRLREAGG